MKNRMTLALLISAGLIGGHAYAIDIGKATSSAGTAVKKIQTLRPKIRRAVSDINALKAVVQDQNASPVEKLDGLVQVTTSLTTITGELLAILAPMGDVIAAIKPGTGKRVTAIVVRVNDAFGTVKMINREVTNILNTMASKEGTTVAKIRAERQAVTAAEIQKQMADVRKNFEEAIARAKAAAK